LVRENREFWGFHHLTFQQHLFGLSLQVRRKTWAQIFTGLFVLSRSFSSKEYIQLRQGANVFARRL
jgi:hypothetical protein